MDPNSQVLGVVAVQDRYPYQQNHECDGACWPGCDRRLSLGNPKRPPFGVHSFGEKKGKLFVIFFFFFFNNLIPFYTFRVPDKR